MLRVSGFWFFKIFFLGVSDFGFRDLGFGFRVNQEEEVVHVSQVCARLVQGVGF